MSRGITSTVLSRFVRPEELDLSPEMARHIVDFKLNDEEQSHLASLAQKSNDGDLTREQQSEYESLVLLGEFLTLMKCKARLFFNPGPAKA